ncbi:hypothetical protein SLEP1_g14126 [Rubroshorea leprosula]|uniref:Uncharacterized protein n=1 Tax=Rubroshorea leprosula TaxID=152421 RepID=A0AAV5INV9_9ROSI|nr:hypothetical protein SLEP1_g14126 [Rubroshorea leprosula]
MFPFFKHTNFESDLDAAFEAEDDKAYLFKGNQYAYINYEEKTLIITGTITEKFSCLKDTKFEDGIEAAFASNKKGEAYLFKGDLYTLVNFDNNCPVEVDAIGNKWSQLWKLGAAQEHDVHLNYCLFQGCCSWQLALFWGGISVVLRSKMSALLQFVSGVMFLVIEIKMSALGCFS